ncbi:hypothetical protein [Rhodosalinus sp.]|uniref:hypothetical protein n=1 Tax=Rhodosalinus sp. TaxID=2047741 RepID=UPI003561A148
MVIDSSQLAMIGGLLSVAAYFPYTIATVRGQATPQRSSWFIWALLSAIAFASVLHSGGTRGLVFTGAQMVGTNTVFLLSLWRGTGSIAQRSDATVLSFSALGLALWWWTDNAAWAMALAIAVGTAGGSLTIAKAFNTPRSEVLTPWILQWLAATFGAASVLGASPLEMAYPLYLFLLYSGIAGATASGRVARRRWGRHTP